MSSGFDSTDSTKLWKDLQGGWLMLVAYIFSWQSASQRSCMMWSREGCYRICRIIVPHPMSLSFSPGYTSRNFPSDPHMMSISAPLSGQLIRLQPSDWESRQKLKVGRFFTGYPSSNARNDKQMNNPFVVAVSSKTVGTTWLMKHQHALTLTCINMH